MTLANLRTLVLRATRVVAIAGCATLAGCARLGFDSPALGQLPIATRAISQTDGDIRVRATIVANDEIQALLGVDLYADGIEPLWLEVENRGEHDARLSLYSIDSEYFSPLEVAWMIRKSYRRDSRGAVEAWLHGNRLERRIPAGETRAGLIFTHATSGTKAFNVDVYSGDDVANLTYYLAPQGFEPDYMRVDFADIYSSSQSARVAAGDDAGLRAALLGLPGTADPAGADLGFSAAVVGTGEALRRALLRSGWVETTSDARPVAAATTFRGRPADGEFVSRRAIIDGTPADEAIRIWLAPLRFGDTPVWLIQSVASGSAIPTGNNLIQDFWYRQSLARVGLLPALTSSDPPITAELVVMFVSERPVAMDDAELIRWD